MGRVKKGKSAVRKDLWADAGGIAALVKTMKSKNITSQKTDYSSGVWSEISLALFGKDNPKNRHWLWVVWTKNWRGIRDLINPHHGKSKELSDELEEESVAGDLQSTDDDRQEKTDQGNILEEDIISAHMQSSEEGEQRKTDQKNIQAEIDDTDEEMQSTDEDKKQKKKSLQSKPQLQQNIEQWRKLPAV